MSKQSEAVLEDNLVKYNKFTLSDTEFKRVLNHLNKGSIFEKAKILRDKFVLPLDGEISIFTKGKGISKEDIHENGNLECIRYGELYTQYDETINNTVSKTNLNAKDLMLSKSNDIIIPSSGETSIDIATASCVLKDYIALGGDLKILKLNLPSLKEQTKIATFLSSIDTKLSQTQIQVNATKEFKKALLQQMFV